MTQVIPFLKKQKKFMFFAVLALIIIVIAILAPVLAPHDPYESVLREAYQAPGPGHLCGTDAMGRDLFSRILYGARISISSSFILVCIVLIIGTLLGMLAGFFGGVTDAVIMRVADTMIAFPDLILAIAIAGILGPNFVNSIIAIAAVSWTKYARIARSLVLKIKNREYIAAAITTGSGSAHILAAYMVPNALPTMVITAVTDLGTIMLSLASLSFLGFGVQPPTPEWGYMLSEGRMYMQTYPWLMIFPGLAIFVTVVVFNLLGDSLRDILDPRSKKKHKRHSKRRKATK